MFERIVTEKITANMIYEIFFHNTDTNEILKNKKLENVLNHFKDKMIIQSINNNIDYQNDAWIIIVNSMFIPLIWNVEINKFTLKKWIKLIKKSEFPAYKTEYNFLDLEGDILKENQKYFWEFEPSKTCKISIKDIQRKKYLYTQISWYEELYDTLKKKFIDFLQDSYDRMIEQEDMKVLLKELENMDKPDIAKIKRIKETYYI